MTMLSKLVTADENFTDAFRRWNEHYRDMPEGWRFSASVGGRTVDEQRKALATAKTIDVFDKVIGNRSWTHPSCDFCGATVRVAVTLKRDWGDDSKTLCKECLTRALACFGPIRDEDTAPVAAASDAAKAAASDAQKAIICRWLSDTPPVAAPVKAEAA